MPDGTKQKYEITIAKEPIFSVAGLWENWLDPENGKGYLGFSVITCPANPLMAEIHNTKKRMPVILSREVENDWIAEPTSEDMLQRLMVPALQDDLVAKEV